MTVKGFDTTFAKAKEKEVSKKNQLAELKNNYVPDRMNNEIKTIVIFSMTLTRFTLSCGFELYLKLDEGLATVARIGQHKKIRIKTL